MSKFAKIITLVYLSLIMIGSLFLGLSIAKAADACTITLYDPVVTDHEIQFKPVLTNYTLKPGEKVYAVGKYTEDGITSTSNTEITDKINPPTTASVAKISRNYSYQGVVIDKSANELCKSSPPIVYNASSNTVSGGTASPGGPGGTSGGTGTTNQIETEFGNAGTAGEFITLVLRWAVPMVGGLALIMMIYAGYLYMVSQGNQEQIGLAKEIIIGVVVGVLLLFVVEILLTNIIGTGR